jgi:hypothetical protein
MGQELFNPPNVSGWKQNAYWLTTSAVSGRALLARDVAAILRRNGGFDNLAAMTVPDAVDTVAVYFGVAPLSASSRDGIIAAYQIERGIPNNTAAARNLLTMMMLTPECHTA